MVLLKQTRLWRLEHSSVRVTWLIKGDKLTCDVWRKLGSCGAMEGTVRDESSDRLEGLQRFSEYRNRSRLSAYLSTLVRCSLFARSSLEVVELTKSLKTANMLLCEECRRLSSFEGFRVTVGNIGSSCGCSRNGNHRALQQSR
jgi:hypothetical protein